MHFATTPPLLFLLLLSSFYVGVLAAGENPFTPKAYLLRYWKKQISNDLPKPDFLLNKISPLTATEYATFSKLASDQTSLSTQLPQFCSKANLLCFPDLAPSLEKHDSDVNFATYSIQNFTNYGTKKAGGRDSFQKYSEDDNVIVDSFRRYSRGSTGHEDKFTKYATHGNVVDQRFNTYGTTATGGEGRFTEYNTGVNIPNLHFTSYSDATNGRKQSFAEYTDHYANVVNQSFTSYGKNGNGALNEFGNYGNTSNVMHSSFGNYGESGNGANDTFSSYATSTNIPDDNFRNYGTRGNAALENFKSYWNLANAGDEGFESYEKNGNGTLNEFANYGNWSNVMGSNFGGYGERGNGTNDTFSSYGTESNRPQDNFRNYGTRGNGAVENFKSYRNQSSVGDDRFESYGKNSNAAELGFENYGQSMNGGSDKFTSYGKDATGATTGFKIYGVNTTFKEYTKEGVNFASYINESSSSVSASLVVAKEKKLSNIWVEPGKFFREEMLKSGTVMPMPEIRDKMPKRSFLPRVIVSKLPFSTSKLAEMKRIFHAGDDSSLSKMLTDSLSECERAPSPGETKRCAPSIEDMIDFATSVLGRNVEVRSTENTKGSNGNIMIGQVKGINGGKVTKSVSCHQSLYPYLLYYCHSVPKVRVYEADILDSKSKSKINQGIAICHLDTSSWSATHGAFIALGSSPGKIEVCHWIFENDMTWTIAD